MRNFQESSNLRMAAEASRAQRRLTGQTSRRAIAAPSRVSTRMAETMMLALVMLLSLVTLLHS